MQSIHTQVKRHIYTANNSGAIPQNENNEGKQQREAGKVRKERKILGFSVPFIFLNYFLTNLYTQRGA